MDRESIPNDGRTGTGWSAAGHSAPTKVMYTYPWDMYDHGVDRTVDELRGCGVDAVQLAFSYHVASFLTPRNPRTRVDRGALGSVHLRPSATPNVSWPFEPPHSERVGSTEDLCDLTASLARNGMKAIAWVVYLYNHAIAHERRHLATVNAFGDRNGAQLCPSNPEVQAYVDALTASVLAHDGLTGFVCESLSFLPFDYGLLNLKAAVRPGHRTRFLLGLCFCPHCHGRYARDGLNVDRFIVDVRAYVDQELARLPDHRDDAPVCEEWIDQAFDGRLRLAHLTRTEVATQLQARVLQTAKQAGLRVGSTSNEETCPFVSGVDEARLQAMRDEFRFELRPSMSTSMLRQSISRARERAGKDDLDRAKPIYGLTQLAHFETERSFVSTYERAFAEGLQHVRLYQFGLLTTRQLRWVAAMPSPSSDTRTLNLGTP